MTIELREMDRNDVAAVAALEATANPSPWSHQLFEGELALPPNSRQWLVGVDPSGAVQGFGGMMYAASTAHLMNLAVASGCRRQGLGLRLCVALFVEARQRGAEDLTLEVRASNAGASALYEKLAMTSAGVRPRYYADGEDAVIYWLHDLQDPAVGRLLHELEAA